MAMNNLGPAERFLVGAIGPPGKRRFYFQVVADGDRHSLLAEKQQVEALASQGWRSLQRSGVEVDTSAVEFILSTDLEIDDPAGTEDFRVGTINVGIRPSGLMNISFESDRDDRGLMFMVSPEQFRAMALVARRLVRAGRPICPGADCRRTSKAMSVPPATEHRTDRLIISELVGRFTAASNATFLGQDPEGVHWVYKPEAGVRHLWDFPPDSLANREIMAYEVSNRMGLDLVPETVEADGPLGPGAAQRYLDPDLDFDHRQWFEERIDPRLWPVAVFDLVANNADRKLGHVLVESDTGRLFAIDHGLTFHSQQKLRTVLWSFAGEPIPDPLVEAVARLRESLEGEMALRAAQLLTPQETNALLRRTENLLDDPRHPHPPADRSALPWPLW